MHQIVKAPFDGKNLNDCWEELFCEITEHVVGSYKKRTGQFAFFLKQNNSLVIFEHVKGTNRITFMLGRINSDIKNDLQIIKSEIERWCSFDRDIHLMYELTERSKGEYRLQTFFKID